MRFISKIVRTFFCAAVVLFLFSCSDNFNKRSGNFTFRLNPRTVDTIKKDERVTDAANLSLEVQLTGEYEDLKNVSLSNTSGIKVRFSDIPVGVKIKAEVKVFSLSSGSGERTVLWSGDSAYFFVLEGENSVDVQMKKISTEEPGEEVGKISGNLFRDGNADGEKSEEKNPAFFSPLSSETTVTEQEGGVSGNCWKIVQKEDMWNGGIMIDLTPFYGTGKNYFISFSAKSAKSESLLTIFSQANVIGEFPIINFSSDKELLNGVLPDCELTTSTAVSVSDSWKKYCFILSSENIEREIKGRTFDSLFLVIYMDSGATYFLDNIVIKDLNADLPRLQILHETIPEDGVDLKDGLKEGVTAYWITNVDGLKKLSEFVNGGNTFAGYTFMLKNDITVNESVLKDGFLEPDEGLDCTPNPNLVNLDSIGCNKGDSSKPFCGTFDGNGKVIKGLYIYQAHQGLGFIGTSGTGAVIKDLTIIDACVINSNASADNDGSDDDRMGGIIGLVSGATEINNCVFTGVVGSAAAKARGGSYEYIDGFVGRADAVVNTSKCIVFARTYGAPNIKVAMNGDVTKYDAAAYKSGDYTGDNKYILEAIKLLNVQQEPESQIISYVPILIVKSETGSSDVQISFTKNNTPNSYIYDTEHDPGCNYPTGVISETDEEGVTYTLLRSLKSSTSESWGDYKVVTVIYNGQPVLSGNCSVYKWTESGMTINSTTYTYVDSIVYTWKDTALSSSFSYRYCIIASKNGCEEKFSNEVEITIKPVPPKGAPYPETPAGEVSEGTNLRFYADLESGDRAATIYYEFVKDGEFSTLTTENYAAVGIKYERAISASESGTFYCIAEHDGLVSEVVSFTYTVITPPGRAEGLAAVETKIATMTHAEVTATADIKDGLIQLTPAQGTEGEDSYVPATYVTEYKVSDAAGLNKLAEIVNAGNTLAGYTFTQATDIRFNDKVLDDNWNAPIEASAGVANAALTVFDGIGNSKRNCFSGTYDGNAYEITGVYVYGAHQYLGFFGVTKNAVIKNLIIKDACVVNAATDGDCDDRFGGIVGVALGGDTFTDCIFMGTVGSEEAKARNCLLEYCGGLIGRADGAAMVSDCVIVAKVTANQNYDIICGKNINNLDMTNVTGYDASK